MLDENRKINEIKIDTKDFTAPPPDKYTVEIVSVDEQKSMYPTEKTKALPKEQQIFLDTFNFKMVILDKHQRGQWLWATTPDVLYITPKNGKNKLYRIIEATIKRDLTQEEIATIDGKKINSLIGKQLCVMTDIKEAGEKKKAKIISFLPCATSLTGLTEEEKIKATTEPKEKQNEHVAQEESNIDNSDPTSDEISSIPF